VKRSGRSWPLTVEMTPTLAINVFLPFSPSDQNARTLRAFDKLVFMGLIVFALLVLMPPRSTVACTRESQKGQEMNTVGFSVITCIPQKATGLRARPSLLQCQRHTQVSHRTPSLWMSLCQLLKACTPASGSN